jgi:hypothetical protein
MSGEMTLQEITERIMTAHWDMAACRCWVCTAGRESGCAPRDKYLLHRNGNREKFPVPPIGWGVEVKLPTLADLVKRVERLERHWAMCDSQS